MATANYGGYDYRFIVKDLDKYTCNICTKVLKDPHLTGCCGQVFCESCLNYWFTKHGKESCPHCRAEGKRLQHLLDKRLKREIYSLRIHCTNKEEGCQWIGELGSLKDHLESANGCDYVEMKCPNRCRKKMKRKNMAKHLKNKCSLRPYQCEHCGHRDTYENITGHGGMREYHYQQCPEYPLKCHNYKCSKTGIKRKDMKDHDRHCQEEMVECPNKCKSQNIKRIHIQKHLKEECALRPYQCEHCRKKGNYTAITTHYSKCPQFPLECPNKCGVKDIKRKDMKDHRSHCPKQPVLCPFDEAGCAHELVRCELEQHMSAAQQQHLEMIKELKMETVRLKLHNMELKQANDATKDVNSRLKQGNSTLHEEVSRTKDEVLRAGFKNSKLLQEKSAIQQANLQEVSRIKQENLRLQQGLLEENSTLRQELSRLQRNHVSLLEEEEQVQFKNAQLEQESSQIKVEVSRLKQENLELQEENSEMEREVSTEKDRNLTLQRENSTLHQKNFRLEQAVSTAMQRNSRLEERNSTELKAGIILLAIISFFIGVLGTIYYYRHQKQ